MTAESDTLSTAVAAFKQDGALGRLDPEFLAQALAASALRAAGGTAAYEKAQFDAVWGDDEETSSDGESTNGFTHGGDDDGDDRSGYYPDDYRPDDNQPHFMGATEPTGPATNPAPFTQTQSRQPLNSSSGYVPTSGTAHIPLRHVPRTQTMMYTSDMKIDCLLSMSRGMWTDVPIIRGGDVIRIRGRSTYKDATVRRLYVNYWFIGSHLTDCGDVHPAPRHL
jgi:hypothetical protein